MSAEDDLPAGRLVWPTNPPPFRKLADKSMWFLKQIELGINWPETCVEWPWRDGDRRHTMNFQGSGVPVTHVVLHFTEGPRPTKKHQALHSCDVQWCINPKHLRWGTELQNRLDQVARSRGDIGKIGMHTAWKIYGELKLMSEKHKVPMDAIARIASTKTWSQESWTEGETTEDAH